MSYRTLALAAACSAALSACVVAPIGRPYGAYGPAYGPGYGPAGEVVVADVAPPAPYYEAAPAPPFAGALWIDGYWGWRGGRHAWVGGRYERARPGYAWQPHHWVQHDRRWHLREGHWARR
ncbi:MAG: hypothetical protein ABIQ33_05860 [Caldimonas sp.]